MLHAQDLLDHRIIEHGSFVPTYTKGCVSEAICEIVEMLNLTLTEKKLTIVYANTTNLELKFDRRRLQSVLLNLLTNATKFQKQGVIEVNSKLRTRQDGQLLLIVSVEDQGIGLTKE